MHTPSEGQELAIKFAIENKYSILAMPPGQGKTLCAVEMALRLKLNALVVCPSYAKKIWINEFKGQCPEIEITTFSKGDQIYPLWDDGVAILSYSLLLDRTNKEDKTKRADSLFEWADLIIFDESHNLKESDNQRTVAAHKLVYENRVPYIVLLSGTPIKNRLYELYSQIALCHYKEDNSTFLDKYPTWVHFANRFSNKTYKVVRTRRGNIPQTTYSGVKNLEELKPILETCYFKLPNKYLHKLPSRVVYNVEADKMRAFPGLVEEFEKFMSGKDGVMPDIKAQAALSTAKFTGQLAKDLLMKHETVVIFTDHVEACKSIAENLTRQLGTLISPVYGEISVSKREIILEEFQKGLKPVIVATTGTLSTAISLTISNVMIMNDLPWVVGDLDQTECRISRRGQEETCFYYRVMATKQSHRISKILDSKRKDIKAIDDLMEGG